MYILYFMKKMHTDFLIIEDILYVVITHRNMEQFVKYIWRGLLPNVVWQAM